MKLYSIHFNRPDFVEIQYNQSKKSNYELVVVNNGRNKDITDVCNRLGIELIEIDNIGKGNPSLSHGSAINQIKDKIDYSKDWGLIDHDLFIVKQIDMLDYDIITWKQLNIPDKPYMWPGFLLCKAGVNLSNVDFRPGVGVGGDTGSDTYKYINKYNVGFIDIKEIGDKTKALKQDSPMLFEFYLKDLIAIHYLNGSNWTNNLDKNKDFLLKNYI
jgi:hypothetical protein